MIKGRLMLFGELKKYVPNIRNNILTYLYFKLKFMEVSKIKVIAYYI